MEQKFYAVLDESRSDETGGHFWGKLCVRARWPLFTRGHFGNVSPEIKLSILKDEFTLAIYHNNSNKSYRHL